MIKGGREAEGEAEAERERKRERERGRGWERGRKRMRTREKTWSTSGQKMVKNWSTSGQQVIKKVVKICAAGRNPPARRAGPGPRRSVRRREAEFTV